MPSHTIHSALVQMYLDSGAPWAFPRWKEITGITHGIFPDDDSPLPKGLTREDLVYLRSYFDQYGKKVKEDDKIKFASATRNSAQVPGRSIWRQWVTDRWKEWGIHTIIISVLKAENCHPITLALAAQDDADDTSNFWPPGNMYIPLVVESVALELFGIDVQNSHGVIPVRIRAIIQALIQRTWKVIHNQVDRSKGRISKLEEEAIRAFETLNQDSPTKAQIKLVIAKVSRWRNLTEFLQSKHNVETMDNMKQALEALMAGLGASVEPPRTKPKTELCKVAPRMLKSLAEQEDVTDVLAMYQDHFSCPAVQDSVDLTEQHPTVSFQFGELEDNSDPGVEMESTLSSDVLASNLGFKDGLPLLFSRYRHRGGLTSWDAGKTHLFDDSEAQGDPDMDPIVLHWHQLAGVHALVRMVFGPDANPARGCGALIADEVGLGKTYQAVAMVAFLTDIVLRQKVSGAPKSGEKGVNTVQSTMPPIIQQNPYAGAITSLLTHDHPHLIIVPGTLLSQWEVEIKSIIKGGTFSIILYASGKAHHDYFWGPDGPFKKAKHSGANILIIASHSALQQDFSLLYSWKKPTGGDLPWANPRRTKEYDSIVPNTLYGQKYLSITLDEAQGYRNVGAKHSSAMVLRELALFFFSLTATPLQTSTKDIAAMGRLIGIPHFLSQAAFDEERADASTLRQARKGPTEDMADEDDINSLTLCQMAIAQRIQKQFEGRVLRRTIDSKDWQGKPLIPLPPYKEIRLVIKLTERELGIISELADDVKESMSVANSFLMIASRNFYIGHRMAVNYARDPQESKIPHFKTLGQWEARKSTKIDTCVKLCLHLLSRDDASEVYVEEGIVVYPPPPVTEIPQVPRQRKIIIYQEFPSHGPLLRNVLDLHGIKYLYLDGQTTFNKRAKIVKEFNEGTECRVLIISSVGSTGLNLSVASAMILLDQPWSAQDERQIRGRIHRQPQSAEVMIFHILGDETADIVLAAMASGKKAMMDAFLMKPNGLAMFELLSGRSLISDGDDRDDDDPEIKEARRSKKQKENAANAKNTRKKAGKAIIDTEKRPTKLAPELADIQDEEDEGNVDGGKSAHRDEFTTDGDTSDGDGLTNGATTDDMSEPATGYDADKSMTSSRAATPSVDDDETGPNNGNIGSDQSRPSDNSGTVAGDEKMAPAPAAPANNGAHKGESETTDEVDPAPASPVNGGEGGEGGDEMTPALPINGDEGGRDGDEMEPHMNESEGEDDDEKVEPGPNSLANSGEKDIEMGPVPAPNQALSTTLLKNVKADEGETIFQANRATSPMENKKRRLVAYASSESSSSSPEPMEQSQGSNPAPMTLAQSRPPSPPSAPTPATQRQRNPLSKPLRIHERRPAAHNPPVPQSNPKTSAPTAQPLRRAPGSNKASKAAPEHVRPEAPKNNNLHQSFNAIMAGSVNTTSQAAGPDRTTAGVSTSAPPPVQKGSTPSLAKRTNPFAKPSTSAGPPPHEAPAKISATSTKPTKRGNPFARKPPATSSSPGPSGSQEAGAAPVRDIPSIRRATTFTSRHEGSGLLSPPSANAQSKNPFKTKRKRA